MQKQVLLVMMATFTRRVPGISHLKGVQYSFPFALVVLTVYTVGDYLQDLQTVLLVGAAAIIATAGRQKPAKTYRFAVVAVICMAFTWLVPVKTLLYFSFMFTLFFWIERLYASIHFLGIAALFLSSPAFHYMAGAFSFPIRLQLTNMVGGLFSLFETDIVLKGNTIFYESREFAVDPACMGLHMLSLSLLLGIFLLGLLQRKARKIVSWKMALLYIGALFLLNIVANVLRIMMLVQFAVPPAAMMHDIIGLLCLLVYVCLPACYLAKAIVTKAKSRAGANERNQFALAGRLHWLLLPLLLLLCIRVTSVDTYSKFSSKYKQVVRGYTSSVFTPGILKLESQNALVYVKYIRGFYDTEHNPTICWQGSGYEFKEVQVKSFVDRAVYTAVLTKGSEKLYTAWWYGNADHATTSQWEWRLNMLKGDSGYALLNVTAASKASLQEEVTGIIKERKLQSLLTE